MIDFLEDFNSKVVEMRHTVAVDSEYQSYTNRPNQLITNQIDHKIYEHPSLKLGLLESWTGETVFVKHFGLKSCRLLEESEDTKNMKELRLQLLFFHSLADVTSCFTCPELQHFIASYCEQRNCVKPIGMWQYLPTDIVLMSQEGVERILKVYPYDLSGICGKKRLQDVLKTLGITSDEKGIPLDKEDMLNMYKTRFEDFVTYAKNDAQILHQVYQRHFEMWNDICHDLDIPTFKPSQTIGSNTSKVARRLIVKSVFGNDDELKTKFSKLMKTEGGVCIGWRGIVKLNEEATTKSLFEDNPKTTAQYLSIVDGGRCRNERVTETTISGVLTDIDISGCYGAGLLNQRYPIGRPCILDFHKNAHKNSDSDPRPMLGNLLNSKIGRDLEDGLWAARISTTEPFTYDQDLLLSKKISSKERDDGGMLRDVDSIDSTSVLLTKELITTTLTSDLLEAVKSVCSDKEWGEFKTKTRVDALIFYPKSLRVDSIDELCKMEKNPPVTKDFVGDKFKEIRTDERSRYWTDIGFDGWIDLLLDKRKQHDKKTPMNDFYKLIVNATYGTICSEHLDVNNVVVASNITARARTLAWLMAKALGCYQTITDGGSFNLNTVYSYEGKPSMNTLCHINRPDLLGRRAKDKIQKVPLGGQEWTVDNGKLFHGDLEICKNKEGKYAYIDKLAWNHVKSFFNSEDISIIRGKGQFVFETEDIFVQASYNAQANNRFVDMNGEVHIKARGYERNKPLFTDKNCETPHRDKPPIDDCLEKIADDAKLSYYPPLWKKQMLKVNAYNRISVNDETKKDLLPGDTESKSTHLRPVSTSAFKYQTESQYDSWSKKSEMLKKKTGMGLEQYFMDSECMYDYQEVLQWVQQKIYEGKSAKCLKNSLY